LQHLTAFNSLKYKQQRLQHPQKISEPENNPTLITSKCHQFSHLENTNQAFIETVLQQQQRQQQPQTRTNRDSTIPSCFIIHKYIVEKSKR
jgi:hypothetical protein